MRARAWRLIAGAAFVLAAHGAEALAAPVDQPTHHRGEAAVRHLGDRLAEVAMRHGLSGAQLAARLRGDATLVVDDAGNVLHVDVVAATTRGAGEPSPSDEPPVDPSQVSRLHSDPASRYRMYLDFDGGVYHPVQSPLVSRAVAIPAFSGGAQAIARIWQRVAEDFAPFDVDVTTELPAPDDLRNCSDGRCGLYVSIGGSPANAGFSADTLGVAPFTGGDAHMLGRGFVPGAFVFPLAVGNSEPDVADTIAHEGGHLFGLLHDGCGGPARVLPRPRRRRDRMVPDHG